MSADPSSDPYQLLQDHFGWAEFKSGQADVIERLLAGESALAVFPTGGGKSLCYQLPALALQGLTVVVSPLIALMKDQIDQLQARNIEAVRLDSSLTMTEYRETMESIRSGRAKMLYVAPERFFNERFRTSLDGIRISLFAIDEAHCISQWGHNFRPDYLKLARISKSLNVERVLALTATATPTVQQDIVDAFDLKTENVICTEFFRPNLQLKSRLVDQSQRIEAICQAIEKRPAGATIVYVSLQKTAVAVASAIEAKGLPAKAYHAGMKPEVRHEIQEWFMSSESGIVVATIAFGMGIDKSDIRYVYHFNPPKSLENYAQEIGRAGRDGKNSICEIHLVPDDRIVLENFVYGDTPTLGALEKFVNEMQKQPAEFFISQYTLSQECDIKRIVLQTLLTYLELEGFLEGSSPRYDSYDFKPMVTSAAIIENFQGERQEFVRRLLSVAKKRAKWFGVDIAAACEKTNSDRSRVVKAFDYFAEQGWMELRTSGLVHGYRKLKEMPSSLATELFERTSGREIAEIDRINQVFELAKATECQAAIISSHFGQPLDQGCGVCTFCSGEEALDLNSSQDGSVSEVQRTEICNLRRINPDVLNSPRVMARFLCGLSSPILTRARLSRHEKFGSMSDVPFGVLMDALESE